MGEFSFRIAVEVVDPVRSAGIASVVLAVLAGLLIGGWIGGELHYRNCLQSVELRHPVAYQPGPSNPYSDPRAHFAFYEKAQRDRALSGCSRWP
jgi:hypothetical protein